MSETIRQELEAAARERILVLDGAMGTMIQDLRLDEAQFRGTRFADWKQDVRGNNDLLILTQSDAVRDIHLAYFKAGADIVATNTFSSTAIAQADYGMEEIVRDLNRDGARLAKEAAALAEKQDGRRRFVAGALGPTNRTASISPDVSNPGFRVSKPQIIKADGAKARIADVRRDRRGTIGWTQRAGDKAPASVLLLGERRGFFSQPRAVAIEIANDSLHSVIGLRDCG